MKRGTVTTAFNEAIIITEKVLIIAIPVILLVVVPQAFIPGWDEKKPLVLLIATGSVVVVFVVSLIILWILHRIGGAPPVANFEATFKKSGGSIKITAPGVVGTFLAIVACAIASLYFLFELLSKK
jgi:hypothetical protein